MTILKNHKLLGVAVLSAALVAGACSSASDEGADTTGTTTAAEETPTTTASVADDSSAAEQETAAGSEEPAMSETLEPAGAVDGGSVTRAYLEDQYPGELDVLIVVMIEDLASRLGIDATGIKVVAVEEVTWSDASLGCPQPGMNYAQVVTDGMRVILEAEAVFYDYRSGGIGDPFLCVRAAVTDKSTTGLYELTEDGVVQVEPPKFDEKVPTEGNNPPEE